MKKQILWRLATILAICSLVIALTSCTDKVDNPIVGDVHSATEYIV